MIQNPGNGKVWACRVKDRDRIYFTAAVSEISKSELVLSSCLIESNVRVNNKDQPVHTTRVDNRCLCENHTENTNTPCVQTAYFSSNAEDGTYTGTDLDNR